MNTPAEGSPAKGSPEEMLSAHAWLDQVASELGLPEEVVRTNIKGILDLTSAVAHNRSRPAAPVTAFLVGLAAGHAASGSAEGNPSADNYSAAAGARITGVTDLALGKN
ncbi:hypothetical protein BJF89_12440 [Corynebacterium sp. CNJ-954]|jgi:hypothetical protein|uniref:DUF6457 domain-containing protein n=1 Tax=Corynebacterium sp. CNJ-954 TaxID=1904962 RepID=UPI000958F43D|nr:DUF6457 domain-containing protein [Corynebacterium sp. CNJ-954]OLT56215.1 hypothetical protein BJF89_12440 [Corynebacterium sp. CNJ-954]